MSELVDEAESGVDIAFAPSASKQRSLSAVERGYLRKAIGSHERWADYSRKTRINQSMLTSSICLALCERWQIDIDVAIAAGAANVQANGQTEQAEHAERKPRAYRLPAPEIVTMDEPKAADDANALASVLQSILSKPVIDQHAVRRIVADELASFNAGIDEDTVKAMIDLHLEGKCLVQTLTINRPDVASVKLEGNFHPQFATLLKAVSTGENVWISGPTGSGKTHAARQVAAALGLPFYLQGAMTQPYEFLGFIKPGDGGYVTTPFRQAYEFGGVCLFDECDASDNSVTLAMNAALANGHGVFPDRPEGVKRHKDLYCIAAGNTWGSGATSDFIGRNKLDAAFMSRFPVKLPWGYDEALELAIAGNDTFTRKVQATRRKASERGLKIVIDPRHSKAGAKLIAAGFTMQEAADMTYLASLTEQQRKELA